jgi:pyruvate dehydrogenase E2 component (dihydrolipoamide acetyltransferase)
VSERKQFKLPDVGEGLTEAEIVSWKVKPGDMVKINEVIVEIETAKSLVELPCPYAGVVTELLAAEGSTVDVGAPIITVEVGLAASPGDARPSEVQAPVGDEAIEPGLIGGPAPGGRTSVLVGYGPKTTTAKRRPRKSTSGDDGSSATPAAASAATAQQAVQTSMMRIRTPLEEPAVEDTEHAAPAHTIDTPPRSGRARVLAKPPVRRLAKELGIDLADVRPSGRDGTVTRADVEAFATGGGAPSADQGLDGGETRTAVKGVRKMTAQAMVASAFTAPHVTEWVTVDVTRTIELVERLRHEPAFADLKVSPLLVLAKALVLAVGRNPGVNATWDEAAQEIVVKHCVNLGIAAATPRGLLVPNIKNAHRLSLVELAQALNDLTTTAREGRTQPADTTGGTITITNVGVFGVDSGTPIINPGESAIVCFGAVRDMPWVHDGQIAIRKVTQLALSFDHRLIDGALGSQFLSDVATVLEDPATALLLW